MVRRCLRGDGRPVAGVAADCDPAYGEISYDQGISRTAFENVFNGLPIRTALESRRILRGYAWLSGVCWHAYLHEETALGYGAPPLEHSVDEVVRRALAWSAEAGLTPSTAALSAAFTVHNAFAEETLDELLDALGLTSEPLGPNG
jgi:hypothetical protein